MDRVQRHRDELEEECAALYPSLVGALTLHVGDRNAAEDIAQETFIRLYARWPRRRPDRVDSWCYRVAFNLAASWFRRRGAEHRAYAKVGELDDVWVDVDRTDLVAIREAVGSLPDRQRTAIVLRFFVGLSNEETADVMDCPGGTVKSLVHRGLATLRTSGLVDFEMTPRA